MKKWFVVQKYLDDGYAKGEVKEYSNLTPEEIDLLENHGGYMEMDKCDWYITEFKTYNKAMEFKREM